MFEVGDTVGDYEIVARLRSGGMATLFLGRRAGAAGFAKHVAIKVVHEHLAQDPQFVEMFVDEALLGARIQHPNVVHVEELREVEGQHFLVMEYVYGGSLAQLLGALHKQRRRLSPVLAAHIALELADGLHAAHEVCGDDGEPLGVVHRDVTPQNVLLSYRGNVKLIDFGVAKAKGRNRQTEAGSIKGKFRYLAPEQAFAREVDRRTDVYQLGIVLWEMLTMRQRFDGRSDANILNKVRYPDPIPPSIHAPGVPPALDDAVLRAMAIEPADRFQTALELRDALVQAMPEAAGIHESVLGQLLEVMLEDDRATEAVSLPESVTSLRATPASTSLSEVVDHLTVSVGNIPLEELADEQTDPSMHAEVKTQLIDVSQEGERPPEIDAAIAAAKAATAARGESPAPIASTPAGVRLSLPVAVAILAGMLVLGAMLTVAIVVALIVRGPDEPTAVELPSARPPAVASAAPDTGPVGAPDDGVDAGVDAGPMDAGVDAGPDAGPRATPTGRRRGAARRGGAANRRGATTGRRRRGGRPMMDEF